ncbi:MAG: hypothetical protein A3J62_02435 [Candidatus Buchananbacteria bacterium RIFCSPHIGHO2_02_FULL_38_8]|uniref:EamA domain-containing protein n=2 Tax=Candidatus Buchananiibacteriota TaxID=1817903 RepID=A0A1G1XXI1_9BACT|nr:MAG: hypothetical protein A2731_00735 [Candidatus Buchananbacteria bacterium RIFCSPHIGHO2_01_FULL_39_8]OGY47202.1 MAG: hypothetical protein A3J62_02435 [Candidatus Buchananbacteria bacterium RIFCSPHIGHO2_02_FULL_38_8]
MTKWIRWAAAEGGTKASNSLISKFIGVATGSFFGAVVASLVVAIIQMIGGLIGARVQRRSLSLMPQQFLGVIAFGTIATLMSWLIVYVFVFPDSDLGVVVFLISLSIIPGAFIDRLFFGQPIRSHQWLGITIFLLAGYAILGFPSLYMLINIPIWVIISLVLALLLAINEAITEFQAHFDAAELYPMVNNFWIGLTNVVLSVIAMMFLLDSFYQFKEFSLAFWAGSVTKGLLVLIMISFKLLSYQGGGTIASKKLVMQGSYLILSTLIGAVIFIDESLTIGKILGMILFFIAFILTDERNWQNFTKRFY